MAGNQSRIIYMELKSGLHDSGPARIGRVSFSKSGRTIKYSGKEFRSQKGAGIGSNHYDVATGEAYWISGPKRDGTDRHWAGGGIVHIDEDAADEYWREIRECAPPKNPLIA
jgi:hypothetical protein